MSRVKARGSHSQHQEHMYHKKIEASATTPYYHSSSPNSNFSYNVAQKIDTYYFNCWLSELANDPTDVIQILSDDLNKVKINKENVSHMWKMAQFSELINHVHPTVVRATLNVLLHILTTCKQITKEDLETLMTCLQPAIINQDTEVCNLMNRVYLSLCHHLKPTIVIEELLEELECPGTFKVARYMDLISVILVSYPAVQYDFQGLTEVVLPHCVHPLAPAGVFVAAVECLANIYRLALLAGHDIGLAWSLHRFKKQAARPTRVRYLIDRLTPRPSSAAQDGELIYSDSLCTRSKESQERRHTQRLHELASRPVTPHSPKNASSGAGSVRLPAIHQCTSYQHDQDNQGLRLYVKSWHNRPCVPRRR